MSGSPGVWVLDDITPKAGQGRAFLAAYLEYYAPIVEQCGLTLVHQFVEPAMWLDDEPNRLLFLWAAPDPAIIWQAKHTLRRNRAIQTWWQEQAPPMIEHRRRAAMAEAGDLEVLADV